MSIRGNIMTLSMGNATLRFETNIAPGVDVISPPIEVTNVELTLGEDDE